MALTHSSAENASSSSSSVLHLLNVHVHAQQDFLAFTRPDLVMDVVENRPAGTILGEAKLRTGSSSRGGGGEAALELRIFPSKVRRLVAASLDTGVMEGAVPQGGGNRSLVRRILVTSRQPLDHETDPLLKFRLVAVNTDTQGTSCRNTYRAVPTYLETTRKTEPVGTVPGTLRIR